MRLSELAIKLDAEHVGPGDPEITGIAGIHDAHEGQITFVSDEKHMASMATCRASAVIVSHTAPPVGLPALKVKNPRLAFAKALRQFYPVTVGAGGVSDRADIARSARLGQGTEVHAFVTVSKDAKVGNGTMLYPGVYVGQGSIIGDDCILYSNVTVREGVIIGNRVIIHPGAVIGSDGFGFVTDEGVHHKIPQVGGVLIEDDVEIGSNSTIDRATLGATIVKQGTKIDNLVQIAHNVIVGEHCLMAALVGIAGSAILGNHVVLGGRSAVKDHVSIGDAVMIGGGAGVTRDIEAGQVVAGHPAIPLRDWLKSQAIIPKLPELKKRIAELERLIQELRNEAHQDQEGGK